MGRRSGRRGPVGWIGNVLLTLLALGGALCIVLVPLALFFHISLVLFKTGSMSPTIPAGSLAVVREMPAGDVHVGDVVTVDRSPLPPVTHRVVAIAQGGGDTRILTLRGDANPGNDPQPYTVQHVRLVIWSAPKLAYVVRAVSNPIALGSITLVAAAIVTWAFWPRAEDYAAGRRRGPKHRSESPRAAPRGARCASGTPRHRAERHFGTVGKLALVVVAAVSASGIARPNEARAGVTQQIIHGDVLTLVSIGDRAQMTHLASGVPVPWQVGVSAHPPRPGTVEISLSAIGPLAEAPSGLQVSVEVCPVRWLGERCASGGRHVLGPGPASSLLARPVLVATMRSDQQRWILVSAGLPARPAQPVSGSAELVVTARGFGDQASAGGNVGPPAATGTDLRGPLMFAAAALVVGLLLTRMARLAGSRRRREQARP